MKLVTFENAARQSRIGALVGNEQIADRRIVDLHTACALYLRDVDSEAIFYRMADALVPPDMRALFRGGDTSLEAARKALDYVVHLGAGGDAVTGVFGPRGETLIYSRSDIQLKAPIVPKKFFHTSAHFPQHHNTPTKPAFSHPATPRTAFFQH